MLAAFTGHEIISRVPVILHTPLMSATNAISGISLGGSLVAAGVVALTSGGPARYGRAAGAVVRPDPLDLIFEARRVDSSHHEAVLARAVLDEPVRDADVVYLRLDAMGGQALTDGTACTAGNHVFLQRDDAGMRRREPADRVLVERLHEAHVDKRGVQLFSQRDARRHHRAERE